MHGQQAGSLLEFSAWEQRVGELAGASLLLKVFDRLPGWMRV